MTITLQSSFISFLTLSSFLSSVLHQASAGTEHKPVQRKKPMKEIMSHFTVYWHDIVGGTNSTVLPITKPADNTTVFGLVNMIDDPLTVGPDLSSKIVGRAQGLYGVTSQKDEFCLLMAMNFVFTDGGKYNGSTITIMGRNAVGNKVREMPVLGGSGAFRFGRGYVQARTHSITNVVATVKYDVYVMHYV